MCSLNVNSLAVQNAKESLASAGLTCFSLTKHPDIPCNNFPGPVLDISVTLRFTKELTYQSSGILASELNKVFNPFSGFMLDPNDELLQDDTKGVILYKGLTAVARLVINPRWGIEPDMGFVVAFEQVLPGYPREGLLSLLLQCTEAFISGYIELSGHKDAGNGSISLVIMCTRGDMDKAFLIRNTGFSLTESYWGNELLADLEIAFEKVLLDASLDDLSDSSSFLEEGDQF